ncbi:MAG TPA: hypothetical protein VIN59_04565 [Alphaproteobacteria bacterium]
MTSTPVVPQHVLDRYFSKANYTDQDRGIVERAFITYADDVTKTIARHDDVRRKNKVMPVGRAATIVAGPGGAGKSVLMQSFNDLLCIDYERALKRFPEIQQLTQYFEGFAAGSDAMQEASTKWLLGSKHNADVMLNTLVGKGRPVAFETTGHGEGMAEFIANLKANGYTVSMALCDTPTAVRDAALFNHYRAENGTYVDPVVNKSKVSGIRSNMEMFAKSVCCLDIYWRDDADKPLTLIARSDKNGQITIVDQDGVNSFNANSVLIKHGTYETLEAMLDHHSDVRRAATMRAEAEAKTGMLGGRIRII